MRAHLIRIGPPLGEAAQTAVDAAAPVGLPLPPDRLEQAYWASPSGCVQVWSWTNEPDRTLNEAPGDGFIGTTGYTRRPAVPVVQDLLAGTDRLDELGGVWSLCGAGERDVVVATAWSSVDGIFRTEGSDGSVWFSTRPLIGHLAAAGRTRPDLDPLGMLGIAMMEHSPTLRTPYQGTRYLEHATVLRAHWDGERVVEQETARSRPERGSELDVETMSQLLLETLQDLPLLDDGTIRMGLTGGRDSRLITSALCHAGYRVDSMTRGLEGGGEVAVARQVAEYLQIPHARVDPGTMSSNAEQMTVPAEQRFWLAAMMGEGMYSAYDGSGAPRPKYSTTRAGLTGAAGEILRGGWAHVHGMADNRNAADYFTNKLLANRKYFDRDMADAYDAEVEEWIERARSEPRETLALYHLARRQAHWSGGARLGASLVATSRVVFMDDQLVRATFAQPLDDLVYERLITHMMDYYKPGISRLPFVSKRLRWDLQAPPQNTPEYRQWQDRKPVPLGPRQVSFNWRFDFTQGLDRLIAERVQQDRTGLIRDDFMHQLMRGEPPKNPGIIAARIAWGAATVGQLSDPGLWEATQRHRVPTGKLTFTLPQTAGDGSGSARPALKQRVRPAVGLPCRTLRRGRRLAGRVRRRMGTLRSRA